LFIPDPYPDFPYPGSRGQKGSGSGSSTLFSCIFFFFTRREIDSALLDRDRVLKENHELREKLGEREKSTGQSRERNTKVQK